MKKYTSIFMLGARPTFYKFLLINLAVAIIQAAVFFIVAGSALSNGYAPSLSNCFNYLQYPFMAYMDTVKGAKHQGIFHNTPPRIIVDNR